MQTRLSMADIQIQRYDLFEAAAEKKVIWQRLFVRHATNCLPSNTKYDIIRNREKDSVLPMFGHTKEASVLRHWSLFILFGKNTPQSSCVSSWNMRYSYLQAYERDGTGRAAKRLTLPLMLKWSFVGLSNMQYLQYTKYTKGRERQCDE